MEFAGLPMSTDDFTTDRIESMLADARYQMEQERLAINGKRSRLVVEGKDDSRPMFIL